MDRNQSVHDDDPWTLHDVMSDDGQEEITHAVIFMSNVRRAFAQLPPREYQIMSWRFGTDDGVEMTLQEIGDILGITREGARQAIKLAVEHLRLIVAGKSVKVNRRRRRKAV